MGHIYKVDFCHKSDVSKTRNTLEIEIVRFFEFDLSGSPLRKEEFEVEFEQEFVKRREAERMWKTEDVQVFSVEYLGYMT